MNRILFFLMSAAALWGQLSLPFDEKAATAFLAQNPDFARAAQTAGAQANAAYAARDYDGARAAADAACAFSFFEKHGGGMDASLQAYLLGNPALLDEFFALLDPRDAADAVAQILQKLWRADAANFRRFPRLACAIALVFDTPPPVDWPHRQVSETCLPRTLGDPEAAFATWADLRDRGRLLFQPERLDIEALKYLVASLATQEDREWVNRSVPVNASTLEKLYPSVPYDTRRLHRGQYDWGYDNYRLKTIRERGGICTDQAYFTVEAAKARGIPAFILSGAGADGFHAWAACMRAPGKWDFGIGRYEGARFVTGRTLDPQTWKTATDHDLNRMCENFRGNEKYRLNELHTRFARAALAEKRFDDALRCARAATAADARNAESWQILLAALAGENAPASARRAALEAAVGSFSKYPDTDAHFRQKLIRLLRENNAEDAAQKLSSSFILKTKTARPDLAMEFARAELEDAIRSGTAAKLQTDYKRLFGTFKDDGAIAYRGIAVPIISALLEQGRYEDAAALVQLTRKLFKSAPDATVLDSLNRLEDIVAKARERARA